MITSSPFGLLPDGREIVEFQLTNSHGHRVHVITLGGIVSQLHVPDRNGQTADIVCGFDRLESYVGGHPYFGSIVGRVAGRLTGGKFSLDGRTYNLAVNDAPNHLHGGLDGFDKRVWAAEVAGDQLRLSYVSPDGEEGYPGTLEVVVIYCLSEANEFSVTYEAVTDAPTPINFTNHSYFNLAGEGRGRIDDHILQIFSQEIVATDDAMTLLGRRESVDRKANDFRQARRLGDAIPHLHQNHGDNYILRHAPAPSPELAARLEDPASGRVMEVLTTERCLQLYCGTALDGSLIGKSRLPYAQHFAVCLECQGYPDGANTADFGNVILRPGEIYEQTTIHQFQNINPQ